MSSRCIPSLDEWKTLNRPYLWPFIRTSKLELLPPPDPDTLFGFVFPSRDKEDRSWLGYAGEGSDKSNEEDDDMEDSTDTSDDGCSDENISEEPISDDEIADLLNGPVDVANVETIDPHTTADHEALEIAERESSERYRPDVVIARITEFYDLLVKMGHWPAAAISKGSHTINVELGKHLGYDDQVLSLMQFLPYINPEWNNKENSIVPNTIMADYRDQGHLVSGKCSTCSRAEDGMPQDPWILPLTLSKQDGIGIFLDTKLGTIIAFKSSGYPAFDLSQAIIAPDRIKYPQPGSYEYRRRYLVPADEYLEGCIDAYRSLQVLPVISSRFNDPTMWDSPDGKVALHDSVKFQVIREQQQALLRLYKEFDWPTDWKRDEFKIKWSQVVDFISEKYELDMEDVME